MEIFPVDLQHAIAIGPVEMFELVFRLPLHVRLLRSHDALLDFICVVLSGDELLIYILLGEGIAADLLIPNVAEVIFLEGRSLSHFVKVLKVEISQDDFPHILLVPQLEEVLLQGHQHFVPLLAYVVHNRDPIF